MKSILSAPFFDPGAVRIDLYFGRAVLPVEHVVAVPVLSPLPFWREKSMRWAVLPVALAVFKPSLNLNTVGAGSGVTAILFRGGFRSARHRYTITPSFGVV
jgi:hypothetical protein